MRLAGTAKQYSTSAMPQPPRMAAHMGICGNFRFPYQAMIMKVLETMSRRMVGMGGGSNSPPPQRQRRAQGLVRWRRRIWIDPALGFDPFDQFVELDGLLGGDEGIGRRKSVLAGGLSRS